MIKKLVVMLSFLVVGFANIATLLPESTNSVQPPLPPVLTPASPHQP